MASTTTELDPRPHKYRSHVGRDYAFTVQSSTENITAWTVTGTVFTAAGGTVLQSFAVTGTTVKTVTITATQQTTLGVGSWWYEFVAVDTGGATHTLQHGHWDVGDRP